MTSVARGLSVPTKDAVGVREILDGRAFAQELGIGADVHSRRPAEAP